MAHVTGQLSGSTLTIAHKDGTETVLLHDYFSFTFVKIEEKYLVTISQNEDIKKCILSLRDCFSLSRMVHKFLVQEKEKAKLEYEKMKKEIEEENKKSVPPQMYQTSNHFNNSASSLKQEDFDNIIESGKISINPYFVKIKHNTYVYKT